MAYRKEKLAHFIREEVGDAIANRVSDPRVSRFTSVTRVELSPDMKVAEVYISIMGTDQEARTTMKGLDSARGMIQTRLAKQLNIRQCPSIRFKLDPGIKKALDTFRQMSAAGAIQPPEDAPQEEAYDAEPEPESDDNP